MDGKTYDNQCFAECKGITIAQQGECQQQPKPAANLKDLGLTKENLPKIDGSTTTEPLSVLIATKAFDTNYEWKYVWNNSTSIEEKRILPKAFNESNAEETEIVNWIRENVKHNTTHNAFVNLIDGNAELVTSARLASDDELKLAKEKGVELESTPIALDAFVIIGNSGNPVENITIENLVKIYAGENTNWNQLGGPDANIHPFQREPNSGSQETMKKLVMKDKKMIDAPQMIIMGMGAINRLEWDTEGICYSFYYYTNYMDPIETIKEFSINGIAPNPENIKTKEYPFTTEVYLINKKGLPEDSKAFALKEWLLSKQGQETIKEAGYVQITE